jgi:hypothetical protein
LIEDTVHTSPPLCVYLRLYIAIRQNIQVVLRKIPEEKRSDVVLPFLCLFVAHVRRQCDPHVLDVLYK